MVANHKMDTSYGLFEREISIDAQENRRRAAWFKYVGLAGVLVVLFVALWTISGPSQLKAGSSMSFAKTRPPAVRAMPLTGFPMRQMKLGCTRKASVNALPIDQQKEKAKEMIRYYRIKGLQRTEANRQVFGWTPNNEILNGRWVMMGLFLGLLTEYATGVNLIGQIKLMLAYTGVIDFD